MATKSIHVLTALIFAFVQPLLAQEAPTLTVTWPPEGAEIPLGTDPEGGVGVVVASNFRLISAGACGALADDHHQPVLVDGQPVTAPVAGHHPRADMKKPATSLWRVSRCRPRGACSSH